MPRGKPAAQPDNASIFFNCPFDASYRPIFEALVFAAFDCGYVARCALEIDDGGEVRVEKIIRMIRSCRLGVHDISRTELDPENRLPRFNMPFELGLFVGAARYGPPEQKRKMCMILDRDRYRFQKFISDIAGQDIYPHGDEPEEAIKSLRKWLSAMSGQTTLPGGMSIVKRYRSFRQQLPEILAELEIEPDEATFADYTNFVQSWLDDQPRPTR
jgi:hypothetical protein